MRHKTPFTYRSTLKFNNVQESDEQDYFCTGKIVNALNHDALEFLSDYANYKLVIHGIINLFKYLKIF